MASSSEALTVSATSPLPERAAPATGLSSEEAAKRLLQYGPNAVAERRPSRSRQFLRRFWGPVPWMLEASLLLELALGKHVQASVIAALLVTNALIAFVQEGRAGDALALLKRRLEVMARVRRDGGWTTLPAHDLVPGDLAHLRQGDLVPADGTLRAGAVLVDASTLTGESLPRELKALGQVFAGCTVVRGEADLVIDATGGRTRFGRTAELVRLGGAPGHVERVVVSIARALVAIDVALVLAIVVFAVATRLDPKDVIPYCLILLVASVPVALPATFSLALALGARELASKGVLVTRLAALEDVAGMEVLCTDKTGTLTQNLLRVGEVKAFASHSGREVIESATLASDRSTQDPLDVAILDARGESELPQTERIQFLPFEASTRRSEALLRASGGGRERVIKGAPATVAELVVQLPADYEEWVHALAASGQRVLAVARGPATALEMIGLIGLRDAVREDSAASVRSLAGLGVRVVMATGDSLPTALAVAQLVGIRAEGPGATAAHGAPEDAMVAATVLAGVFPEDKFKLVRGHQSRFHITGMTGDGVNDAPALKQAEVGIAVSNAVDVAKAAASLVLTSPGLSGIDGAVEVGRRVFQRMRTYTLNKVVKTLQVSVYLTVGLFWLREMVVTPRLILLLLFANDFVTMSLSADNVTASRLPEKWDVPGLIKTAVGLAGGWLALGFAGLWVASHVLRLPLAQVQTLGFLFLVFTGQATVYLCREKRRFWMSLPGTSLLCATAGDILAVVSLAVRGLWMASVPVLFVMLLLATVLAGTFVLDELKVRFLRPLS